MPRNAPDFFAEYRAGRISHVQAMQAFFHHAPSEPENLETLLRDTMPDPELANAVRRLEASGWDLIIVSAGSSWYIERILQTAGVTATIHSNPGVIEAGRGLVLTPPEDSPFFSPEVGVDKPAVVRDAMKRYQRVAFAGDGPPDVEPALLVPPRLRFARRFLAEALEPGSFRTFQRWSEVVEALLNDREDD